METFYISPEQFWARFNGEDDQDERGNNFGGKNQRVHNETLDNMAASSKRLKTDRKPKNISDTEAFNKVDARYIILWTRSRPGRKNKIWEGDGYLSMVGQVAHVCDLRGRLLEEPTLLDEIDYNLVKDLDVLTIGNTEIKVEELDS